MKKEVDELTKCKRMYSGELLIFGIIFIILGLLFVLGIIKVADWKKWLFTCITFFGGLWAIIDFVWTLKSEKRQAKNPLIDKIVMLPNGITLVVLDIIVFINLIKNPNWIGFGYSNFFQIEIGVALIYCAVVFIFEGIYHYKHIHPMVYEMLEENKEKEDKKD